MRDAEPLDGRTYADAREAAGVPEDPSSDPYADAEGVVIVCGASETDGDGWGALPSQFRAVRGRHRVEPAVAVDEVRLDFRR